MAQTVDSIPINLDPNTTREFIPEPEEAPANVVIGGRYTLQKKRSAQAA